MIDIALLRIIKYREQFNKVHRYIPHSAIDKRTKILVSDFKKFFETDEQAEVISADAFNSLFFNSYHKNMSEEDTKFFSKLLTNIQKDESQAVTKAIVNQLLELEFATEVGNVIELYQQGAETEIVPLISKLVEGVGSSLERTNNFEYAVLDDDLMKEDIDESGLKWALDCLNGAMRPLRGGDAVIVAARPDAGKTSFLTHNLTYMAQFTDKPFIWLNNESKKERILRRSLQSALNCTNQELMGKQQAGTMLDEYLQVVGSKGQIRVFDIHGWDNGKIEDLLLAQGDIGLIVFDMLDNVKFKGMKADARTDQVLESMYQWARELAVEHDCPVIETSQVSNEGHGLQFPSENMLKDSKTGKQGACDVILMIGKDDDVLKDRSRFLSVPKNKLKVEGSNQLRQEVLFDYDRGRYVEQ